MNVMCQNHKRLLVTELISCNNLKANGQIGSRVMLKDVVPAALSLLVWTERVNLSAEAFNRGLV